MSWSSNLLEAMTPGMVQPAMMGLAGAGLTNSLLAAVAIAVLFVLIVGGYYLLRRGQARRRRETLASAIEAQASVAPRSLSDPGQRAALDKLRQRFQAGLKEFQSRGKDIFRLPWYMIIGEPGSGKTEAIRHSGVEFPQGLQNELQGSGGTVNMDWWFTNHGVILDTAGRLIFNDSPPGEAAEWSEFLRLLKKTRFHCPINGLFVVLSIESLIKDSAEQITQKARRLAQQLDLIQRTLDVRFPVYLLVTKTDLLAGFREFFEDVDDPLLRNQMFGWSNPDPLDAPFRPELVGEHLTSIADQLRRRRLALLGSCSERRLRGAPALAATSDTLSTQPIIRRIDAVEALFALPESLLRLTPRLHRYLETIFTTGQWSPRPVFLRGIYFTSSMAEGKALDEAISFATGLPLDQLPEDVSWGNTRAYFLRDLFTEKVFRESGLVTRAANTVRMLRRRRLAILSAGAVAALLLLGMAVYGYSNLKQAVLDEADYWRVGARKTREGNWSPRLVAAREDNWRLYSYAGDAMVDAVGKPTLVQYHARLKELVEHELAGGLVFRPISWVLPGGIDARPRAQRILFENWMVKPLVSDVRTKVRRTSPVATDLASVGRHKDALLGLIELEADGVAGDFVMSSNAPGRYLHTFLSYLTEKNINTDSSLVDVFAGTYSKDARARNAGQWPPVDLLEGNSLPANRTLAAGLTNLHTASVQIDQGILEHLKLLNSWVEQLRSYSDAEQKWLADPSFELRQSLTLAKINLVVPWTQIRLASNSLPSALTDLSSAYGFLESASSNASPGSLLGSVKTIVNLLPEPTRTKPIFDPLENVLEKLASTATADVQNSYYRQQKSLPALDRDLLAPVSGRPAWEARWNLYQEISALNGVEVKLSTNDVGTAWRALAEWTNKVAQFQMDLLHYTGPLKDQVQNAFRRTSSDTAQRFKSRLVEEYARLVAVKFAEWANPLQDPGEIIARREWFGRLQHDLEGAGALGGQAAVLGPVQQRLASAEQSTLDQMGRYLRRQIGFPVIASAPEVMDAKGLIAARQLLDSLGAELAQPLWKERPDLAERCQALHRDLKKYQTVIEPLVARGQKVAQVEITASSYQKLSNADKAVFATFRRGQVADAPGTPSEDLTKSKRPLATRPADQPITLVLRADDDGVLQTNLPPWWLFRAIADGKAEPVQDGSQWKIRIPVVDPGRRLNGNAVFDVRLVSEAPFPKREEWME